MAESNHLKKALGTRQFFSLSFAAIVGVGWIVVFGDWIKQAGPMGAILAFVGSAVVMMLVGLCYAELATTLPVSGGEIAYAYEVFGLRTSFMIGWLLALVYISTTSFEAISAGWMAGILFPTLRGRTLYAIHGVPVTTGGIVCALGGTIFLTLLNCLDTNWSAKFQDIFTQLKLCLGVLFVIAAICWGRTGNLNPLFASVEAGSAWKGILAVFLTATFWLSGFSVVAQVIEEKRPETSYGRVATTLLLSIAAASVFYCSVIFSCSTAMPWQRLQDMQFPAAAIFQAGLHSPPYANAILVLGLLGIFATWNSFLIASSRTLFALGRGRVIDRRFAHVHAVFGSPVTAIVFVGLISAIGTLLGRGGIAPIVNMVSGCLVLVYLIVALAVIQMRRIQPNRVRPYRIPGGLLVPILAVIVSLVMLFQSFYLPYGEARGGRVPLEWILFTGWVVFGVLVWCASRPTRDAIADSVRRELVLGAVIGPQSQVTFASRASTPGAL